MYQRGSDGPRRDSLQSTYPNAFQEVLKMKLTKTMSLLLAAILGIGTLASCAVDDGHVSPEQGGTTAAITVESNEGSVTAELEDLTYVCLRINPRD